MIFWKIRFFCPPSQLPLPLVFCHLLSLPPLLLLGSFPSTSPPSLPFPPPKQKIHTVVTVGAKIIVRVVAAMSSGRRTIIVRALVAIVTPERKINKIQF
jgi:hypothetical protein